MVFVFRNFQRFKTHGRKHRKYEENENAAFHCVRSFRNCGHLKIASHIIKVIKRGE